MGSTFDFSPLFRSTVGFDRLMSLLESAAGVDETAPGYPPYNIEKLDANDYRVTMAVAGFGAGDLHIETRENTLVVTGKAEGGETARTWLHRGIAGRPFRRRFQLADFMKVTGAHLGNGLLHIDLVREVPEEMRPRRIEISTRAPETVLSKAKKLVEGKKKAA
jgi:molecular chaperone IbpA